MAEADWTAWTAATNGALDSGDVSKGVSNAFTPPNGGGSFIHAFHSLQPVAGVAGYNYSALSAFNPITGQKCGSMRGVLRRYAAGVGYAPMIGFITGTTLASSKAYILGLSNTDPYQYVLRKGLVSGGLDPTGDDVIRKSDESFNSNTLWHQLRLDVIVNPQGDVVLNVLASDLTLHTVSSPSWAAVPGMDSFTDDGNGILTGTLPLTTGFRPFFSHFNEGESGKVSMFDQLEAFRQL